MIKLKDILAAAVVVILIPTSESTDSLQSTVNNDDWLYDPEDLYFYENAREKYHHLVYLKNLFKLIVEDQEMMKGNTGARTSWGESEAFLTAKSFKIDMEVIIQFYEDIQMCVVNSTLSPLFYKRYDCVKHVLNNGSYYRRLISSLYSRYVKSDSDDFSGRRVFDLVLSYFQNHGTLAEHLECSANTIHMKMLEFYNALVFVYLQSYRLILSSYSTYSTAAVANDSSSSVQQELRTNMMEELLEFKLTTVLVSKEATRVMSRATRNIHRCDPEVHKRNVTYERLSGLLQGWVGGEEYLNANHTCGHKCSFKKTKFFDFHTTNRSENIIGEFDKNLIRTGDMYECSVAPIFNRIAVQVLPQDSERLYSYFSVVKNSVSLINWGRDKRKEGFRDIFFQRKSVRHYNYTQAKDGTRNYCDVCLCYNDIQTNEFNYQTNHSKSGFAFSSIPVSVPPECFVTGIRWVVRDRVVYLEVRGHEIFNGTLIEKSGSWYGEPRTSTSEPDQLIHLNANQRSLCLEDVSTPQDIFVTGAQFEIIDGVICITLIGIHYEKNRKREELILGQVDASEFAPTKNPKSSKERSKPSRQFIRFQPTDFKKDAAQSVVPYLDIQDVVTDPPSPLQGLGIYYKGLEGYGGFVGLKILTANYSESMLNYLTSNRFKKIDNLPWNNFQQSNDHP